MASIARQMVTALETAILRNPGVLSVRSPDGTTVTYASPEARDAQLLRYKRMLAKEEGRRPLIAQIDLSRTY